MTTNKTLTAANDNPGGAAQVNVAMIGLIKLLAQAAAQRAANTNAAPTIDTRAQAKEAAQ